MHGEAASTPLQDLDAMCENLHQILKNYDSEDIFNCDKTGLFWKIKPNHTISNGLVARTKQSKDHIKVNILLKDENEIDIDFNAETQIHFVYMKELEEIQDLIDKPNFKNLFTTDKFVQYDNSELTAEIISNKEILKPILSNNQKKKAEELENSEFFLLILYNKAIKLTPCLRNGLNISASLRTGGQLNSVPLGQLNSLSLR
ncbi:hypothetical protein C1645_832787 [Glomus cerebriforme]|uniref:Uncharacterized protein n=1 Tax=Glomus cerebriforme TaxID=658196 RepID=A0A397SMN2_9GLOM|nr:hypothetical protein C1645_832787 [Glomus cerebriforme]